MSYVRKSHVCYRVGIFFGVHYILHCFVYYSIDMVMAYMQDYFDRARTFTQDNPAELHELCMLCIQCLEVGLKTIVALICKVRLLTLSHKERERERI